MNIKKTRKLKRNKDNSIYWGFKKNNNHTYCKDLILRYIKFEIPFINNNIAKLCTEFNNLNDMIKEIYHISKTDATTKTILNKIQSIKDSENKNTLFNNKNANLILQKINAFDYKLLSQLGGNNTANKDITYNNKESEQLCKGNVNLQFTVEEIRFFKLFSKKWEPMQLIFQTLGSTVYISYIGDLMALCLALIRGVDMTTVVILSLSIIMVGLGNAIKFGYLAKDVHTAIKILKPKIDHFVT